MIGQAEPGVCPKSRFGSDIASISRVALSCRFATFRNASTTSLPIFAPTHDSGRGMDPSPTWSPAPYAASAYLLHG